MKTQASIGNVRARLVEFAQSKVGSERGWQARFAELLQISPQQVSNLIAARDSIGPGIREKLAAVGCDIEWLMTGKKSEQARGDPAKEELITVLKEAGITSPKQLRELLEQHEQLRRSLGPAAYQTVLEIARVAEHRGKYGGRKRRKKLG